jgi:hypothetical protein
MKERERECEREKEKRQREILRCLAVCSMNQVPTLFPSLTPLMLHPSRGIYAVTTVESTAVLPVSTLPTRSFRFPVAPHVHLLPSVSAVCAQLHTQLAHQLRSPAYFMRFV